MAVLFLIKLFKKSIYHAPKFCNIAFFCSLINGVQEFVGDAYRNRCTKLEPYLTQLFVDVPGDYDRFVPVIIRGAEVILDMFENYNVAGCGR